MLLVGHGVVLQDPFIRVEIIRFIDLRTDRGDLVQDVRHLTRGIIAEALCEWVTG